MKIGHFGTASLFAFLAALGLLIIQLAVPFGAVDYTDADNDAGIDDSTVSAGDIAADFKDSNRYNLPNPDVAFLGIIFSLIAGVLLLATGLMPMGVNVARFTGWGLALLGATGSWLAFSSSAYWLGTGFATLLGIITGNPHEDARMWIISPVIVATGALLMLHAFLRVGTGVISTRDGLRDHAKRHTRTVTLAAVFLVGMLVVPWSFQLIDGDERRDNGECAQNSVCEGRLDWYTAWGTSGGATLSGLQISIDNIGDVSDAYGGYGGILSISESSKDLGFDLFAHASFSLKVLTAAAWIAFFAGTLATLGGVITSATGRNFEATAIVYAGALVMLAWAAIQFILLAAYQWRPTYDNDILPDSQSWWFGFVPLLVAPIITVLGVRQWGLVRPLFGSVTRVAKEKAETAHSFD